MPQRNLKEPVFITTQHQEYEDARSMGVIGVFICSVVTAFIYYQFKVVDYSVYGAIGTFFTTLLFKVFRAGYLALIWYVVTIIAFTGGVLLIFKVLVDYSFGI